MTTPIMGIVIHSEASNKPPIKLAATAKIEDRNIPNFLFLILPVTSLGELSNAPSANASPTSKYSKYIPIPIGMVIPNARMIAFVKSVLLRNITKSLKIPEKL